MNRQRIIDPASLQDQVPPTYRPSPIGELFHASTDVVRGVMGPVGSGKSVMCVNELIGRCFQQKPYNGVRRSRWACIRNTFDQLKTTTINTFKEWIPSWLCPISGAPPITGHMACKLPDGTRVEAEIHFIAMDSDDDVRKMKSIDLTGVWINEASEILESTLRIARSRIPRYPSKAMGGPSWHGIIMDTNPPDTDSWWYRMAEIEKPLGFRFFKQPPALIRVPNTDPVQWLPNDGSHGLPAAENVNNQTIGFRYWLDMLPGNSMDWINVFIEGHYGTTASGKLVYPEYKDEMHCAKTNLDPYRGLPIVLGWDFGLTPACVIGQLSPRGQLRILDEFYSEDEGIRSFARQTVRPALLNKYHDCMVISKGDPAGNAKSQSGEMTCLQELDQAGIPTTMARTNEPIARREAVAGFLNRMVDGHPAFLLSPTCGMLRKGFREKYYYRKIQLPGENRYRETPEKNAWSHTQDALQYLALEAEGGGSLPYLQFSGSARHHHGSGERREVVVSKSGGYT